MLKKTAISIIVAVLIISMSACGMSNNQQKPLNTAVAQASAAPSATQPAAKQAETQSPAAATPSNSKNLKDVKGLSLIKEQTFNIDLNSWGNVNFVSGKLTGGAHVPVVFYLTNENGDILYEFNAVLPYSVDVKAVSFEDLNMDEKKDIIIIVADNDGSGLQAATVFFQKADGSFANDTKLDSEINTTVKNKDVKTIADYITAKNK